MKNKFFSYVACHKIFILNEEIHIIVHSMIVQLRSAIMIEWILKKLDEVNVTSAVDPPAEGHLCNQVFGGCV